MTRTERCISDEILKSWLNSRALTAIVHSKKAEDGRPHEDQDDTRPAVIVRRSTSRDRKDIVATRLNDVVDCHQICGTSKTQKHVHCQFSFLLGQA